MASIKDIAKTAGVSIGTVDRVIHDRGRYSPQTAEKIRAAMELLGYSPNLPARNLSLSRKCRLSVLMPFPEQDSGYWHLPLAGMNRAVNLLQVYQVKMKVYFYDRYRRESFLKAAEELAKEPREGLLLAPLLDKETRSWLESLPEDLPRVFFDTDLKGAGRFCYLGQDSLKSGLLAGRLMNLLTGSPDKPSPGKSGGEILIVSPMAENEHLEKRIRGFTQGVHQPCRLIRVSIQWDKNRHSFFRQMEKEISKKTLGLYVVDASAHHTADFLRERENRRKIPLVGFDLIPENRPGVEEGLIDFLLTQRPEEQGYGGISCLYRKIMLADENAGDIIMPTDILTRENLPGAGMDPAGTLNE